MNVDEWDEHEPDSVSLEGQVTQQVPSLPLMESSMSVTVVWCLGAADRFSFPNSLVTRCSRLKSFSGRMARRPSEDAAFPMLWGRQTSHYNAELDTLIYKCLFIIPIKNTQISIT